MYLQECWFDIEAYTFVSVCFCDTVFVFSINPKTGRYLKGLRWSQTVCSYNFSSFIEVCLCSVIFTVKSLVSAHLCVLLTFMALLMKCRRTSWDCWIPFLCHNIIFQLGCCLLTHVRVQPHGQQSVKKCWKDLYRQSTCIFGLFQQHLKLQEPKI